MAYLDYITFNVQTAIIHFEVMRCFSGISQILDPASLPDILSPMQMIRHRCGTLQINLISDRFPLNSQAAVLAFTDSTRVLKEYVALNKGAAFPKPEINPESKDIGPVLNQNLHGTGSHQMVIVTHPLFLEAADSIAEFHRIHDNMSVLVSNYRAGV